MEIFILYVLLLVVEYISNCILLIFAAGNGFLVFLSVILAIVWMIVSLIIGTKIAQKMKNADTTWGKIIIGLMVYIIYSSVFWLIVSTILWIKENV